MWFSVKLHNLKLFNINILFSFIYGPYSTLTYLRKLYTFTSMVVTKLIATILNQNEEEIQI